MSSGNQRLPYRFASGLALRMNYASPNSRPKTMNDECLGPGLTGSPSGLPRFRVLLGTNPKMEKDYSSKKPEDSPSSVSCNCQRPACLVKCSTCGHYFTGRVRRKCLVHPNQMFLMDVEVCPKCKASSLHEYPRDKK